MSTYTTATGAESVSPPSNIVFIICDDLGYGDIACHGNPHVRTPHIDRIAAEGMQLTRYCSGPVCTPARASLMTGRHPYRTGAFDTYLGRSMLHPDEVTLPELLSEAGYRTGLFGKWHLGDRFPMRPMERGFEEALYHTGGGLEQPANAGCRSYFNPDLMHNGKRVTSSGYCTDVFTDAALDFIGECADKPFFAYVGFNAPHTPLQIGESWLHRYREMGIPEEEARLYGMVDNIDVNVGRIMDRLEKLGVLDNTLLVFTSDHGPAGSPRYNDGLRGRKGSIFEGGLRVPALLRWPDVLPAATTFDHLAGPIDWLPTIARWAGAKVPTDRTIDGVDLQLDTPSANREDRSMCFQWHRGDLPIARRNAAVIGERFKLMWPETQPAMLFDLKNDPNEVENIISTHSVQRDAMMAIYDAWFADVCGERGEKTFDAPAIVIGDDAEPDSLLTWQDWRLYRAHENEWWDVTMPGFWVVRIARSGDYRVTIDLPEIQEGEVLEFLCGSFSQTVPLMPKCRTICLDNVSLEQGETRLEALLKKDDQTRGVIQVLVAGPVKSKK